MKYLAFLKLIDKVSQITNIRDYRWKYNFENITILKSLKCQGMRIHNPYQKTKVNRNFDQMI